MKKPDDTLTEEQKLEKEIVDIERAAQAFIFSSEEAQDYWQRLAHETYDMIEGKISVFKRPDSNPSDSSETEPAETPINLNRIGIAQQRIKTEFQRALTTFDNPFEIVMDSVVDKKEQLLTPLVVKRGLSLVMDANNPITAIVDAVGISLVENSIGFRLHKTIKKLPSGQNKVDISWVPTTLDNTLQDPVIGRDLYKFFVSSQPKFVLEDLAEEGKLLKDKVENLVPYTDSKQQEKDARQGDVDGNAFTARSLTHDVRVLEFWGTLVDPNTGKVLTYKGEKLKNVQIIFANDGVMIGEPKKNKSYSGESPATITNLLRTNTAKYRPGILTLGAELNSHLNTLVKAMIDAGLKESHNVNVVYQEYLNDPDVVANGIEYNSTISLADGAPLNLDVIKSLPLGKLSQSMFALYEKIDQVFSEAVYANQQFLAGATSNASATSQIQAQNVLSGLFDALAAVVEDVLIESMGLKTFHEMIMCRKYFSDGDLYWMFSGDVERAKIFKEMSDKELLDSYGYIFRFRCKGLKGLAANKAKSAQLVNTISVLFGNPILAQEVMDRFSPGALISSILKANGIDPEELALSEENLKLVELRKALVAAHAQQKELEMQAPTGGQALPEPTNAPQGEPSPFPVGQQSGQGE